jgi:predicted DNA-binding transcriptional regulator AlpA
MNTVELEKYIGWNEAQAYFGGISRVTAWRLWRTGQLPAPIRITPGRCAWALSDIKAWQDSRRAKPGSDAA